MRDRPSELARWVMVFMQHLVMDKPDTYYYCNVQKLAERIGFSVHAIRNALNGLTKCGLLIKTPWETRRRVRPGSRKTKSRLVNRFKVSRLGLSYEPAVPIYLRNVDRIKKELAAYLEMKGKVVEAAEDKTIGSIAHTHDREYLRLVEKKWGRRFRKREFGTMPR